MSSRKRASNRVLPEYKKDEDLDDLLVFGYQCKLFRDDEKAKFIDAGRHLIPWMGDDSLLIDRYDGRGHLHDLRPYDVANCTWDDTGEGGRMEELLNEERYLEMHGDITDRQIYEEEELKRLGEALADDNGFSAVGFSYDTPEEQNTQPSPQEYTAGEEEEEDPYVPIPELQVPTTMHAPATMKQHAIIEKTALFISSHGSQMEIMIKTKQQNNPQFCFLDYDNELNPYYKHMLTALRKGRYRPAPRQRTHSGEGEGTGYLHPSLTKPDHPESAASRQEFLTSVRSKLPAGQIANTPYAKLLSNLSKHTARSSPEPTVHNMIPGVSSNGQHETATNNVLASKQSSKVMDFATAPGQPPPPGLGPPQPLPSTEPQHPTASGSDDSSLHGPSIIPPPPNMRTIVDKMADYVARNGPEFEVIVGVKRDDRFQFLEKWHPYHAYYCSTKAAMIRELERERNGEKSDKDSDTSSNKAVSFSIKSKENEGGGAIIGGRGTVLPYESSEEEEGAEDGKQSAAPVQQTVPTQLVDNTQSPSPAVNSSEDSRSSKSQEDKIRDRLSAAARDKMAQAGRQKQLQVERKKKAAMFINMLHRAKAAQTVGSRAVQEMGGGSYSDSPASISTSDTPLDTSPAHRLSPSSTLHKSSSLSPDRHLASSPIRKIASSASLQLKRSHTRSRSRSRSMAKRQRRSRSRSRSTSRSHHSHRSHSKKKSSRRRSRSRSRKSSKSHRRHHSRTRHRSRSRHRRSRRSRSSSRSRKHKSSKSKKHRKNSSPETKPRFVPLVETTPLESGSSSHHTTPHSSSSELSDGEVKDVVNEDTSVSPPATEVTLDPPPGPPLPHSSVPSELMSKVRAMLKASREAVLKEDKEDLILTGTPPPPCEEEEEDEEREEGETSESTS